MPKPNNDSMALVPRIEFEGPLLRFDFPGLAIGVAEYDEGPTGCTVFHFAKPALCVGDVRGGMPGTIGDQEGAVSAICFAGGSLLGLEAATGVAAELFAMGGYKTDWMGIPFVRGAICFDFARESAIYPDKELGRAATRAAQPGVFPLGARGAGRNVRVGKSIDMDRSEPAGQGGAFRQVGAAKVAVFSVVNALGAIVDRDGRVVRGHLDRPSGTRRSIADEVERALSERADVPAAAGNTTLTLLVTNQQVSQYELRQLGRQVHASMARCIQPFHTQFDGDVLYAVSTNEVREQALSLTALGVIASELAWDAVLASFDAGQSVPIVRA